MQSPHLWSSSTWWTLAIFYHQCSIKEILDFAYHLNSEQLGFKNFRAPWNLSWSTPLHHWAATDSFVVKWENSQHFAKPPLIFPQIDDWGMSWEILYWWRFTNQIWAVLLIGQSNLPWVTTIQKHYPDLGSNMSSGPNFHAHFPHIIHKETRGGMAKRRLISQANFVGNCS